MDVPTVVVVGQIARDLIVLIDEVPGAGEAAGVRSRHEVLSGKGANQAVALTVALLRGDTPERAAQLAVAAATVTVGHAGGRDWTRDHYERTLPKSSCSRCRSSVSGHGRRKDASGQPSPFLDAVHGHRLME